MKKTIKVVLGVLLILLSITFDTTAQTYRRTGNNFESISKRKSAQQVFKTKYTYTDSKGNKYPIYITEKGKCFVYKTSQKTGKEYKYYLPKDISQQICKELNIIPEK